MLAKKYRLTKDKDFEKVFKKGKGFKEDFLFLKSIKNGLDYSRIGIVVSSKLAKKATERNLIKRRLRELARKSILKIKPGFDIAIVASAGINKKTSFKRTEETFRKLLLKSAIFQEK